MLEVNSASYLSYHRKEKKVTSKKDGIFVLHIIKWTIRAFVKNSFIYLLAALGLHCGSRASLVVVQGLSCPVASGILVPQPGLESTSPELESRLLITWISEVQTIRLTMYPEDAFILS